MKSLWVPLLFRLAPSSEISIQPGSALRFLMLVPLLVVSAGTRAAEIIPSAGDILQYVLPATAGGLTLAYRDWKGTLEFGESVALTGGVTYGLKYAVNESRPNGGTQSFPSAHTSISFSAAAPQR